MGTRIHGFTLIELSIVLVILGLLVGGILAGQSLIRASELRAVTTEYQRYVTAGQAFKDKYFYLPGDIPNASQIWGAFNGTTGIGTNCRAEQPNLATCNGNGSGQINMGNSSVNTYENYLVWKHLSNAGLIDGSYSGSPAVYAGNTMCITTHAGLAGCTFPASKLGNSSAWILGYRGSLSGDNYLFDGDYGHTLILLNDASNNPLAPQNPVMKAEELWNIDSKIDDGQPAFGKVVAAMRTQCTTGAATSADGANATYILTSNANICMAVFRNVF